MKIKHEKPPKGLDYERVIKAALATLKRIPRAQPPEGLDQLVRGIAVAERAKAAAWFGVPVPPDDECRIVVADSEGFVRAQVAMMKSVSGESKRTSWSESVLCGTQLGSAVSMTTAFFQDQDVDGSEMVLFVHAPSITRYGLAAEKRGVNFSDAIAKPLLHEETHRLQFLKASWLAESRRQTFAAKNRARAAGRDEDFLALSREEDALYILMEGHASVSESEADPALPITALRVVQADLRAESQKQRAVSSLAAKKIEAVDAGHIFVEAAIAEIGKDKFNEIAWAGPENTPTLEEFDRPLAWCARVCG